MKTLVLATMLATAAIEVPDPPPPDPAPSPHECTKFGKDIVVTVMNAREKGTPRADLFASVGLQDPAALSPSARVPGTIKLIMDTIYALYLWPSELDPKGEVAAAFAANLCFEVRQRQAG